MAKINFLYRGKKQVGKLSIRLTHSTNIDYRVSSPIISKRKYWFKRTTLKNQRTGLKHLKLNELQGTGSAELKNHKAELEKIQNNILNKFITDNNKGVPITKEWLRQVISECASILDTKEKISQAQKHIDIQNQREEESKKRIHTLNLLSNSVEKMFIKYKTNENELKKYKVTLNFLKRFEEYSNKKFLIKELNQDFADTFMNWAYLEQSYQKSYVNAQLKRLRASAVRAYENDEDEVINISRTLRTFKMFDKIYKDKVVIHLTYDELDKIDNKEVPRHLLDAKKAILLGCETGLRYSDMNKLIDTNIKNISGVNYWKFRTEKTDSIVQITISDRILYLIDKYGTPTTNYPDNGVKLNRDIKEVCKEAKIEETIKGSKATVLNIKDKKVIRNRLTSLPKYELITTRTLRRSFATNYYGKIDTALITSITGHSTEKQLRTYLNVSDESNIPKTKEQIDRFHRERKEAKNNIKFTVIPKTSSLN